MPKASWTGALAAVFALGCLPASAAHANAAPRNECDHPRPEWIWCDDFENDRLSSYFEASMTRRSGVGLDGSYGAVARYRPGTSEAGNLKLAFGRTPHRRFRAVDNGIRDHREIYWRVYLKHPPDWQGGGGDKLSRAMVLSGPGREQAMIAHVWSGAEGTPQEAYLKIDPVSGTDGAGRVRTIKYNDFKNFRWLGAKTGRTPIFSREQLGKWHCVEAHVRLNEKGKANGSFRLWINDRLEAEQSDLDWLDVFDGYGINAVFLENYWNDGPPVEQERYMDNFVVSSKRIGCGRRQ